MKRMNENFKAFVKESLEIEGIFRDPTSEELEETWWFVNLDRIFISDLVKLVSVYQPDAKLRTTEQDRVWIGEREAPKGGQPLLYKLDSLLDNVNSWLGEDTQLAHQEYEYLHPFTDGNGRSGRAIWANLMFKQGYDFKYKFLQMYYYQTLQQYSLEKEET